MSAPEDPRIPEGTLLAHYRVEGVLGAGGMGTVYRAHDTSLDRPVAIKVLRSQFSDEPVIVDRFVREARAAARVVHPNLAHIYFVGEVGGHRFFTMEFVPGSSLEAYVEEVGPLPLDEAVDLIVQAATGLGATHAAGVIHRDVKPANLIRRPDGLLKVADFGLSKSLDGDVGSTGVGTIVGTPTYMSPEQCRGEEVDPRTDIYALGLVAYHLLAGGPAFPSEAVGKVLDDQMNRPLPSLLSTRPELSPLVDDVLAKLCAKKPDDRPADMATVIELFETIRPRAVEPAPIVVRAFAFGIDAVVVGTFFFASVGALFVVDDLGVPNVLTSTLRYEFYVGFLVLMHLVLEITKSTSMGKYLGHLEVVSNDGTPPGAVQLTLRFLLRYPSALLALVGPLGIDMLVIGLWMSQAAALFIGFAAALFPARRTLSDRLTRTLVTTRIRRVDDD